MEGKNNNKIYIQENTINPKDSYKYLTIFRKRLGRFHKIFKYFFSSLSFYFNLYIRIRLKREKENKFTPGFLSVLDGNLNNVCYPLENIFLTSHPFEI